MLDLLMLKTKTDIWKALGMIGNSIFKGQCYLSKAPYKGNTSEKPARSGWVDDQNKKAFGALKRRLAESPVLYAPD